MNVTKIALVAAFAAVAAGPALAQDVAKPEKVATCAACHGEDGVSRVPIYPKLAGQHRNYLVKALEEYKAGARKNAIMGGMAANLSEDDIKALALWYSSQKPVVYTVDPEAKEGEKAAPAAAEKKG